MLGRLLAHPLETVELLRDERLHTVGRVEVVEPGAVVADDVVVALAELLADGVELLAEHELALLLVHALADVVADRLGDLQLVEVVARPRVDRVDPVGHIDRLQHPQPVLVVELGPQRDRVGELSRRFDRAEQLGEATRVAQLRDQLERGSQLPHRCFDA